MLKKLKKHWFTLIEIIIATSILTISVFWVYKLIWENTKLITNFDSQKQSNSLFLSLEQCINYIWIANFKASSNTWYTFNFWSDLKWCLTWTTNNIILDNIEYKLYWNITGSWTNYIDWDLSVFSENNGKISKKFVEVE